MRGGAAALLVALALPLSLASCTTTREIVEEEGRRETTLFVTQAGDTVTMQWKSEPGIQYTILFAENRGSQARWQPLAGAIRIPGTGSEIQWTDTVPRGAQRFYRLHGEEMAGGK